MNKEMDLASLISFDSSNRCFARSENATSETEVKLVDLLDSKFLDSLKLSQSAIHNEIFEVLRMRILSILIPEEALQSESEFIKPAIRRHLKNYGLEAREDVVSALKHYADNFRDKALKNRRKYTISDVRVRYRSKFEEILGKQCGRCATCGTELHYGSNMQLDHIFPWHFGDDPSSGTNWQFLCEMCNRGKGEWPNYVANYSKIAWLHTGTSFSLSESLRYAVLIRDKKCCVTARRPMETELIVRKKVESGNFLLDNLETVSANLPD
ncbi:hypothetical protein DB346_23065 [Verrucomicrobia bacterium LW23]|nr:hypothetical protein DB346_23065 [Verrucomicrobia bacterium LW23]